MIPSIYQIDNPTPIEISDINGLSTTLAGFALSSHTHETITYPVTIKDGTSQGVPLFLTGNTQYNRIEITKNVNHSTKVAVGYNADNICAYMKISGASTELNVYDTYVRVKGNLTVTGTITGQSLTITHRAPIVEPLENYQLGRPVFSAGIQGEVSPTDCIPSVKSSGTYREYLGIIVKLNEATLGDEEHDPTPASIDFATHGDYLFYVNNSSNYNIGDVLTYDGSIIADDTNINIIILTSIVGKVTGIIDEHTVALFKQ